MTVRLKAALPLCAAATVLLAVTGCHAGAASSGTSGTSGQKKPPSEAAASSTTQAATAAGGAATPAGRHACSVVSQQEASTALTEDPGPGQESPRSVAGVGACIYGGVIGAGVKVSVDTYGVGKAVYDGDRSSYPDSSVTDVPGVGDGAFEITSSDSQATVYLYKGATFVSITLDTGATPGPVKEAVITLAAAAAGRV